MREYINIVNDILFEAVRYEDLLNPLISAILSDDPPEDTKNRIPNLESNFKQEIDWAKAILKKNDRIVWYLRLCRLRMMRNLRNNSSMLSDKQFKELVFDFEQKSGNKMSNDDWSIINHSYFKERLKHFLSLPIAEIQNMVFRWQTPSDMFNELGNIEKEWKAESSGLIPYEPDDGSVVLSFPDGYLWLLLDRPTCRKEGEAMGHCGNTGSPHPGDRILSFRRVVKKGNNTFYQPFLTFILDKDGYLGEMKGRGNDKPAAKYHKYIVSLLEMNQIEGIKGGGYAPENNFALSDLDTETMNRLLDKKPELGTALDCYKKFGMSEKLARRIMHDLDENGIDYVRWGKDYSYMVVEDFKDWFQLIEEHGDDDAKHYLQYVDGDNFLEIDIGDERDAARTILDDLPKGSLEKIIDYLKTEHADIVADYEENNGEVDSVSDVADVLDESSDEVWYQLLRSYEDGVRYGSETEMISAYEDALRSLDDDYVEIRFDNEKNELAWDTPCEIIVPTEKLLKLLSEDCYDYRWLEDQIKLNVPHYGFFDYDGKGAVESFLSEYPQFKVEKTDAVV